MKNFLTLVTFILLHTNNATSSPLKTWASKTSSLKKLNAGYEHISTSLNAINNDGTISLQDGNLTMYDPSYSNNIDLNDFRKLNNFAENIGIAKGNTILAIEKKQPIMLTDTIVFKMWQMQQKQYQLEFVTTNMDHPGLVGLLEDNYLHTATEISLNGTTKRDFSITADTASANIYRFRIIFKTLITVPLPLTTISLQALQQNKNIILDWRASHEINIKQYVLEKSTDKIQFTNAVTITDIRNNNSTSDYHYVDQSAEATTNYYRIKSINYNDQVQYSQVLKVSLSNTAAVKVFSNPVTGNVVSFQINNMLPGNYTAKLINNYGQVIGTKQIIYDGGLLMTKIGPGKRLESGTYQLQVARANEQAVTIKIVALKE